MLEAFVQFVRNQFPSIDPYVADECINAIRQHSTSASHFFEATALPELAQGDILDPVVVLVSDSDGRPSTSSGPAMLLSNTCDAENDDFLIMARGFPYAAFESDGRLAHVKTNEIYNLFYLPAVPRVGDLVFDFSLFHSVERNRTHKLVTAGTTQRVASLSQLGYYLFLSKLTVHLLRPETHDVKRKNIVT